ncbi:DUF805 domain-containing protein [Maricaulis maris]|uniref:Uncharacterized membrane protein YhaH (DUF805 family) n=1 Tax=Maricaulis maris TaxID=74318 RepID=A0A495DKK8_9PROT|nr:DUF805 domain-containing protein [Maricaulis maris]RKR03149.1 uncharacterized membrane protein YhaH (DUF805 family) [Maricaulis maris]
MDWQFLLLNPNGRIAARDYWIGVAIIIGGNILADIIPILGGLIWLGLIWVGLCVYGKRLHDTGRSAAIHALPWLVSFALAIVAVMMVGGAILSAVLSGGDIGPAMFLSAGGGLLTLGGLGTLIWAGYTVWLGMAPGQGGDNLYGAAPAIESGPVTVDPQPTAGKDDDRPG